MKNSRKIFLSACVATMVASSAHAIMGGGSFSDTNLKDENKNGNYSFIVDKDTGSIYNISSVIGSSFDGKTNKFINHLNIDAAKSIFTIDGSTQDATIGHYYIKSEDKDKFYSFNIKAQELIFSGNKATLNVGNTGIIEGDLSLKDNAVLAISNGTLGGQSANGSLLVKGNFAAENANFDFYGNHSFHITGKANIINSTFKASNAPVSENGIFLLSADGGFNKNITTSNTAGIYKEFYIDKNENIFISILTGKTPGYIGADGLTPTNTIEVKIDGLEYKLATIGNSLYLQADTSAWKNYKPNEISQNLIIAKQKVLTQLSNHLRAQIGLPVPRNKNQQELNAEIEKIIEKIDAEIDKLNKSTTVFNQQVDAVLASLLTSNRQQAAGSALTDAMVGNAQQAKNVVNSARESANNSNRQGAIQVINLANEMAISTRMMQDRNQGENSVWSNAFGGANMIGSESDSVYGVTLGIDRQFSDSVLFGAYLTYADSKLNYNSISQDADNLQFGAYSRITNGQHEFDIKTYAQFSYTDQERFLNGTSNKSDYTQTFLGASGAYGYVFNMGDKFDIKPLIGLNVYYGKTPDYTENGVWAQKVYSMDSFAASAEIGAEFRKGFDSGSYFYITPKIEQFFATSGNDFKGHFTGSNMNYHVAGAEKDKTFGKILIGSNISLTDRFSVDLSIGAKQILGNKDDNTDETYLTGNIGVKYSF
ncbi:autotransporter outer membrane beta-barrel domain-containing protein [Campylobacter lari]|uniref:autotransporter family protein n=1 Tax=Campylobacter lari TaxID=201 RepID=UPI00057D7CEF|nr:autotransporter outer membrane beta-barrel domain-containing protein [Campylobacter lari]AJC88997.1 autotransporter domain protein [Campylobacter lari subsp. concheus LMG 11760]